MRKRHEPMNDRVLLTRQALEAYRNQGKGTQAGKRLRFYCPIHGGDNQRSLSLDPATGFFRCFSCGAVGQLQDKRDEWVEQRRLQNQLQAGGRRRGPEPVNATWTPPPRPEPEPRTELDEQLHKLQDWLPGSPGARYLDARGIPLDLAQQYGLGYAPAGEWPHLDNQGRPCRQWKHGRLVIPHQNPAGQLVNLYGRAVDVGTDQAPKELRHDHLPGPKGNFNATALLKPAAILCEGAFDALALLAAGYPAVALFGLAGLRWPWVKARRVIFAFDADGPGRAGLNKQARAAVLLGKEVYFLGAEAYQGHKDLNEAWAATGRLDLGPLGEAEEERAAILEAEGLTRAEANRRALGLE